MRSSVYLGLGCLFAVLSGCSNNPAGPTESAAPAATASEGGGAKKYTIAVIPKGTQHDFWKSIHAGAIKAARELGNVEIIWKGPVKEDDREQQIQVVETFVNRGVDAIVLAPLDRRALVQPVRRATKKDIPVVIIDSALDYEEITSYVSTDNYNGGVMAARRLAELLNNKGKVVVLRYQVGSASTEQREQGFLDTIKQDFPEIEVLSDEQYSGSDRDGAINKAENLLTRFGDEINGWFCPCEPVTYGTLVALRNRGMIGKIKVVGFDATPQVVDSLRKGEIQGLILQDPINMGYLGVKTAVAKLEGEAVEQRVSTGENLVTLENMDEPASKQLHSPDLSQYLGE